MATREYKEKFMGMKKEEGEHKIVVTHLTVRQSIFFLHLRLIVAELIATVGLIIFLSIILSSNILMQIGELVLIVCILFLVLYATGKIIITLLIIISWLNEYYEITSDAVTYRKGMFFKKQRRSLLAHIASIEIDQGVFGKIFNFGTLRMFNWTTEKYEVLYLIHNPAKYYSILQKLLPEADKIKKVFREHVLEPEDDSI